MDIGFDIISDLDLLPNENFNWEGKATSLYCLVVGNISSDLRTILQTLAHLSRFYQGVFYTIGSLEYDGVDDLSIRTEEILAITKKIPNVAVLHHHVVIIDGVAILGANCWDPSADENNFEIIDQVKRARMEDIAYLKKSVEKLQKHLDVKKILIVTHAVPKIELYFGEHPKQLNSRQIYPDICIDADSETKISHWVFGSYNKTVDTTIDNVNYINNGYFKRKPYWAKRISVSC